MWRLQMRTRLSREDRRGVHSATCRLFRFRHKMAANRMSTVTVTSWEGVCQMTEVEVMSGQLSARVVIMIISCSG